MGDDFVGVGGIVAARVVDVHALADGDGGAHGDHGGVSERVAIAAEGGEGLDEADERVLDRVVDVRVVAAEDRADDANEARRERPQERTRRDAVAPHREAGQLQRRRGRRLYARRPNGLVIHAQFTHRVFNVIRRA